MKNKDDSSVYLYSFFMAAGAVSFSEVFHLSTGVKFLLEVGCFGSAYAYIVDMLNFKYKKIFSNCGLINKDNETPRLKNMLKHLISNSGNMTFSIPKGLCQDDFLKVKSQLEVAFKKNINLVYNEDFTIAIENNNELIKQLEIIFINCGLINKYKITPTLIKSAKIKDRLQMVLSIPDGLCYEDFLKVKSQLEVAFKMPLKLTNNKDYTITLERDNNVYFVDIQLV